MKKFYLLAAVVAGASLVGCSNDDELSSLSQESNIPAELVAFEETNNSESRVGFDAQGTFYWSNGDRIGLFTEPDAKGSHTCAPYALDKGKGTGHGIFSLDRKDGIWGGGNSLGFAVYPHDFAYDLKKLNDGDVRFSYKFPSTYEYTSVDQDFFTAKQGTGNSFNAPMFGKVENNKVTFKHLGAVFCVKIDKMPLTEGNMVFRANGKRINGAFIVRYDVQKPKSVPFIKADQLNKVTADQTVTISFKGAVKGQPGVFYVPVPVDTYKSAKGFNIRVKIDVPGQPGVIGNDGVDGAPITIYDYKVPTTRSYSMKRGSLQVVNAVNQMPATPAK